MAAAIAKGRLSKRLVCTKGQSIDLVADPATTSGLYEQADGGAEHDAAAEAAPVSWDKLTLEQLRRHRADLVCEVEQAYESQLEQVRARLDEMIAKEEV